MLRVRDVLAAFHDLNSRFFGGRLGVPKLAIRRMKHDLARWYSPDTDYPAGLVVLHSGTHPWTWRSTLLHEMVHIAVPTDEADHHGPLFTAEANRVGALLGLDACEVSDAWNWPCHHEASLPSYGDENILDD